MAGRSRWDWGTGFSHTAHLCGFHWCWRPAVRVKTSSPTSPARIRSPVKTCFACWPRRWAVRPVGAYASVPGISPDPDWLACCCGTYCSPVTVNARQEHSEGLHVPYHAQPGTVPRVAFTQPSLPRRRAYPYRYLVRPHAQKRLVVARATAHRRQHFHSVGANHAVIGFADTNTTGATGYLLQGPSGQRGRFARPEPGVPHQANHRHVKSSPPASIGHPFRMPAPAAALLIGALPYGQVAV